MQYGADKIISVENRAKNISEDFVTPPQPQPILNTLSIGHQLFCSTRFHIDWV